MGNTTVDGPLGLGIGSVGGFSLEYIIIIGLVLLCCVLCCGMANFVRKVRRAQRIGRARDLRARQKRAERAKEMRQRESSRVDLEAVRPSSPAADTEKQPPASIMVSATRCA